MYPKYRCGNCCQLFSVVDSLSKVTNKEIIDRLRQGTIAIAMEHQYTFLTLGDRQESRVVCPTHDSHTCANGEIGIGTLVGLIERPESTTRP